MPGGKLERRLLQADVVAPRAHRRGAGHRIFACYRGTQGFVHVEQFVDPDPSAIARMGTLRTARSRT